MEEMKLINDKAANMLPRADPSRWQQWPGQPWFSFQSKQPLDATRDKESRVCKSVPVVARMKVDGKKDRHDERATSLCDYYAARTAAVSHRAVWAVNTIRSDAAETHGLTEHINWVLTGISKRDAQEMSKVLALESIIDHVRCPYPIVHGRFDVLGVRQAQHAFEAAGEAGVNVTPRVIRKDETAAEHCQHDNPSLGQDMIGNGLARRFKLEQPRRSAARQRLSKIHNHLWRGDIPMKAKITGLKTLFVVLGVACVSPASAADFTMKLAHQAAPGEPRDLGAHKVADLLNGKNSCNLEVQVYPSSQLGGSNDAVQLLQLGSVEASLLPASFLVGFQPLLGLMDLPYYLPSDPQKLVQVHHSQAMKDLLATTSSKGVVSLGIWHTGYKEWTGPRPMVKPEDYKGLVARVMPSQVLAEQNRLLGMQNVSMNFGETYSALQNGTIQAQDNPVPLIYAMKFHEVQKYMTVTNHGTLDQVFMVSKVWWDRLPASCQGEIEAAVEEGSKVSFEKTYEDVNKSLKAIEESGLKVVAITAEQRKVLAETLKPTRQFYVNLTKGEGQKYLDKFDEAIAAVEK